MCDDAELPRGAKTASSTSINLLLPTADCFLLYRRLFIHERRFALSRLVCLRLQDLLLLLPPGGNYFLSTFISPLFRKNILLFFYPSGL